MCRLTKIIMKARSYFRAKQWELGQLHETEDDLQTLLTLLFCGEAQAKILNKH